MPLPVPLPDNPKKWEGWRNYNSDNLYERLCLSFDSNPSSDQIEDHCRQLLVWWQKKLPLKNQPSNPVTQMLRSGLDEAPHFLAEARTKLTDAETRARIDTELQANLRSKAFVELNKFVAFATAGGTLSESDEQNLHHVGMAAGLTLEEIKQAVDAELEKRGAKRIPKMEPPAPAPPPAAGAPVPAGSQSPFDEFRRVLRLSGLTDDDLTDDQRDALCNMGENLGLTGGQAEDLIDEYLEEVSGLPISQPVTAAERLVAAAPKVAAAHSFAPKPEPRPAAQPAINTSPLARALERQKYPNYTNLLGMEMLLAPSGVFRMGSTAPDAAPNEQPLTQVTLGCFYMSRFPVTNAEYEAFDPSHRTRRAPWADDRHPAVYVSSGEAEKFCKWLSAKERRTYRLPTEAEWEYAARGYDHRNYPWGAKLNQNDLANFADCNTGFAWREVQINDGYAETAPVGSYPRGASPFGFEDMSGNVWEWCLDYYEDYKGKDRVNPRGLSNGSKRIYRGGSWKSRASSLRATARNFNLPNFSSNDVGFRVVCECA